MIQHLRNAPLLVALNLPASAATPYAECAWESDTLQPKEKEVWAVIAAFSPKYGDTVDPMGSFR